MGNPCESSFSYIASLKPSVDICDSFVVSDGQFRYPFLTWTSFFQFRKREEGFSGGFSSEGVALIENERYSSWACIYEDSCERLKRDQDLACFNYSDVSRRAPCSQHVLQNSAEPDVFPQLRSEESSTTGVWHRGPP